MAIFSLFDKNDPCREGEVGGNKTLSLREEEIVTLTMEGLTDKEIAARLQIAPSTIKSYWIRIRQKTRTSTRIQALMSMNGSPARKLSDLHGHCLKSMLKHSCLSMIVCNEDSTVLEAYLPDSQLSQFLLGRQLKSLMPRTAAWDESLFRVRMNGTRQKLECEVSYRGQPVRMLGELMPLSGASNDQYLFMLASGVEACDAEIA